MQWALNIAERGWVPDSLIQKGIRRLLKSRIEEMKDGQAAEEFAEIMRHGPVAIETDSANEQHYEVPPEFFAIVLGRHLKYSCGYWPQGISSLDESETSALRLTCNRAGIENGMEILDLGCGWGSLSLWIAEHFPKCRVTAVSNSLPQGDFLRDRAAERGLVNVEVLTADMNHFQMARTFDRIVSVEMFEHMRNYALLMERVSRWLKPGGKLFVHIFCHRSQPYFFENRGAGDWMARHFFTGGLMPSERLLDEFSGPLSLDHRWRLDGRHYEKTCRAWLQRMDERREEVMEIFNVVYGSEAERFFHRWRMFFFACAELFGFNGGEEWFVSHSLWSKSESAVH
jgi:cyclopropane-fatty-acyl-phospholipid synthase